MSMLHAPWGCPHQISTHPFLHWFDSNATIRLWACCILLNHAHIGYQHISSFIDSIHLLLQDYEHIAYSSIMPTLDINTTLPSSIRLAYDKIMRSLHSSHQTSVQCHDSRITSEITIKSMRREFWVRFMHRMTHSLRDVEVVELSVLGVGIPHWSNPLIQSEDSIKWKSKSSTPRHKHDVLFWKQSVGTSISFCNPLKEY
jgi:hypothetical protein